MDQSYKNEDKDWEGEDEDIEDEKESTYVKVTEDGEVDDNKKGEKDHGKTSDVEKKSYCDIDEDNMVHEVGGGTKVGLI
jgi:hypothetical protein